ncbi:MAG: protein kinase [Planctomycetota bacterium]
MTLVERYERWFEEGNHVLTEFLSDADCDASQLRELVLTDQYLRHRSGLSYEPNQYLDLGNLKTDREFQLELWLEALGYAEQDGTPVDEFLIRVPEDLIGEVAQQCSEAPEPADTIRPPELARYRVEGELGRGAFGIVYRAWDTQLDRAVALKVLRPQAASEPDFAEARLIAGLEHPGLVAVYDCGLDQRNQGFIVTQLVEGQTLAEWAASLEGHRQEDQKRVCELFTRLCDALAAAHERGVVHRDLKPSNVLIRGDDQPVLLDFGLALSNWTPGREGEWVGTPAYMSPEQARGEGHLVDPRSDVFAVGILLFEVLTGERPWRSDSTRELLREIAHGSVRSVRQLQLGIPFELESVCRKATAAVMMERYGSAREMANDLRWLSEKGTAPNEFAADHRIAARGLRPYTAEDSESFWTLLPGYRNARGIPETVAWWLDHLQEGSEPRRAVLVLYGPSGSGKSSLLHAGVLPHLDSRRSLVCSLDASEFESSDTLTQELKRKTKLESGANLSELIAGLRDRSSRHTVITIDQFEQVLTWDADDRRQMVFALRQADGIRLQFVLVVRDDFWSATSRLMRDLDSSLRDGRNAMSLERFSATHARHVLQTWSQSAPDGSEVDDDFVETAIALIAEGDRVIPVRLALLASVLGEEPWTIGRLDAISRRGSLSAYFLDSLLGAATSVEGRRFSEPARRVLRALTPPTGLIRGPAISTGELQSLSGLDDDGFADLLDLLDRRSHLITPVDRSDRGSESAGESIDYNLPHDFLVSELRSWLEEVERTTTRGRAALDLRAAAQRWSKEQASKQLAGPLDCLRFGLFARPAEESERRFLRVSAKRSLMRSMAVAVIALVVAALFQIVLLRVDGRAVIARLSDCSVDQLPDVIRETRNKWLFTERPLRDALRRSTDEEDLAQRDRFALALLHQEPEQAIYLSDRVLSCEPALLFEVLTRMRSDLAEEDLRATVDRFASVAGEELYVNQERLRAAVAIASLQPDHPCWEQSVGSICRMLVASDPTEIGWMAEGVWPVRATLTPELKRLVTDSDAEQLRTATYLLAKFASDDEAALVEILEDATLAQLSAVAPAIRAADDSIDTRLASRLDELLDDYLDVAIDMELQPMRFNPNMPDGPGTLLANRRVTVARRIANVAALMLQRGCGDRCFDLLKSTSDPTLRSYVIHCYAISEGPAKPLAQELLRERGGESEAFSADVAAALLQTLASLPASSQIPTSVRELARKWSRSTSHRELNASAEYFLRQQGYASDADEFANTLSTIFATSEGHVMVRLPDAERAVVGASPLDTNQLANERSHEITIPKGVYFSRHEVTVEQFNRFLRARRRPAMESRGGSDSEAVLRVGFYQAAAYCNWLSDQEGIPEDQWCFLPNANGHYAAGMSIAPDALTREGYQLPTADWWEYACRAGSSTPRHYGYGTELSSPYVRWMGSREGSRRNLIAVRKPNAFGLFDMLGNASEWSLSVVSNTNANFGSMNLEGQSPESRRFFERSSRAGLAFGGGPEYESVIGKTISDRTRFLMLGGSFDSPAHKIRSSDRSMVSPPVTNQPIGIRLMRVVRDEEPSRSN